MKVALDAMGGDRAPRVVVEGAAWASGELDCHIVLVGKERSIKKFLNKADYVKNKISIENATEVIKMNDPAAISVRRKKHSSISIGIDLLKEKRVDAFISAGSTGAVVCAGALKLRTLPGIERPGIGVVLPTLKNPCMVIDIGANIETTPRHLLHYGVMGLAYAKYILGRHNPSVGILNIGQEESKGTELVREARQLFEKTDLNFIGNVEARDVYSGKADVVVCEGFVGNIVLKVTESFAESTSALLKQELTKRLLPKIGAILSLPAYRAIRKKIDYSEYGGAPLLGIDGRIIIAHGNSNAKAIKNAVRAAIEYVKHKINKHIIEDIEKINV
ncbi:MAG: phosphate acyltransferase PlsX [Candidatus Omnitrophica bacterium]|nr:phosphate acyltransferase PlsX [Candidatus Omnitrophota bacterium]